MHYRPESALYSHPHCALSPRTSLMKNPDGLITASHDFLAKIWDLDGNLLGKLDYNEPGVNTAIQSKRLWKYKPEVAKTVQHTNHEEDFHEMLMHQPVPEVAPSKTISNKVATNKVLHRHPSQENFLNREFHHLEKKVVGFGSTRSLMKPVKKVHRVTSWTRDTANELIREERAKELKKRMQRTKTKGRGISPLGFDEKEEDAAAGANIAYKHWDGMMDTLNVFKTALVNHTHRRTSVVEDGWMQRQKQVLFDSAPKEGKHWKLAQAPKEMKRTVPRQPLASRPQTSPSKMMRRGRGGADSFSSSILARHRPSTGTGGGSGSRGRPGSHGAGLGAIKDGDKGKITVAIKLKHMGFC